MKRFSSSDSVGFLGITDLGETPFLITADALREMPNPDLERMDPKATLETFVKFATVIRRVARREPVKRLGRTPILITSADLKFEPLKGHRSFSMNLPAKPSA